MVIDRNLCRDNQLVPIPFVIQPPGADSRTRSSLSYSGLAQTLPAAQSKVALGGQLLEVVPKLGAWSMGYRL